MRVFTGPTPGQGGLEGHTADDSLIHEALLAREVGGQDLKVLKVQVRESPIADFMPGSRAGKKESEMRRKLMDEAIGDLGPGGL